MVEYDNGHFLLQRQRSQQRYDAGPHQGLPDGLNALLARRRPPVEIVAQLQEQSGQSVFSDQATALILSQALNTTVSNRLQRLFGASNIKIDPQGLTTETNPTARGPQVTIEQEFANNFSLTYSTNVSQSSEQIIQGEYYVNRNVSVVGTREPVKTNAVQPWHLSRNT